MNKLPKDIEPLFGLWVLFELKKCSKKYQNEILKEINIEPSALTDPQTLVARIRTLDTTGPTRLTPSPPHSADHGIQCVRHGGSLWPSQPPLHWPHLSNLLASVF